MPEPGTQKVWRESPFSNRWERLRCRLFGHNEQIGGHPRVVTCAWCGADRDYVQSDYPQERRDG